MKPCYCPKCLGVPQEWVEGWTVWDWHQTLITSGFKEFEVAFWEDVAHTRSRSCGKCPGCGKPSHPDRVCKKKDFDNYQVA